MNDVEHNLEIVLRRIEKACESCGRNPQEVKLLMATKTVNPERIKTALNTGQRLIGENKVQEVRDKFEALKDTKHTSHFIGHLQTNKIKDILKYGVSCIQSVDRLKLANKLQKRLEFEKKELDVYIQVNTSEEESKYGIAPERAIELTKQVASLDRLHIKGLMTIGLFSAEETKVRKCFQILKGIQQEIIALGLSGVEMKELSMGMSGDLETAIEEGATIIRVGTAIFGKRVYPDSYYWNEKNKAD